MSAVLYLLGSVAMAVGLGLIGFGIPINEFSLGNTLIIAGSTVASGGLVVISLAAVHSQLRRLAQGQAAKPAARALRPAEPAEPVPAAPHRPAPQAPRVPFPQRPRPESREPRGADVRAPEPRMSARDAQDDLSSDRPRANLSAAFHDLEPSIAEANEEAPLSPRAPSRLSPSSSATQSEHFAFDPKAWSSGSGRSSAGAVGRSGPPAAVPRSPRPDRLSPTERAPAGERPGFFDAVWPAGSRSGSSTKSGPGAPRELAEQPKQPEAAASKAGDDPVPMAILKSGVVDGMAYTLYTDGSIEAELAQGVMRFNSIEDLRAHLEKSA